MPTERRIYFICPGCDFWQSAPPTLAGRSARCPKCGKHVYVPAPVVVSETPTEPVTVDPVTKAGLSNC